MANTPAPQARPPRALTMARVVVLILALVAISAVLRAFIIRVVYPYDLEWMEGGALTHALRIAQRLPTYAPPSVDFVPFLYTPFYPLLISIFPVGYLSARLISVIAFLLATYLGYRFAARHGGSRVIAIIAMAIPFAAYASTGVWYDLARADSLFLLLVTAASLLAFNQRDSVAGAIGSALFLVLAFFTKQTASPFMIAIGLFWLVVNWRYAFIYGATLAIVGAPLLYAFNVATDGWFWTYIFKLHQQHPFHMIRAFLGTPTRLILLLGPSLLLLPWAVIRLRTPAVRFAIYLAFIGLAVACVGFGTEWAWHNAFIPGIFFPSIAFGVIAGQLQAKPTPAFITLAALAMTLAIAPGALLKPASKFTPHEWGIHADAPTGYDLRPYLPSPMDREHGDQLIAKLREAPGDVMIPFHPFYAHLAGKPCFLHRMGAIDVYGAGLGFPQGLAESFRQKRFSVVIVDDKIAGTWHVLPGLQENYKQRELVHGPPMFAGAMTSPSQVMVPK